MHTVNHLKVPKNSEGKRFAISDVHGCSKTFKALIKKIGLKKKDQLFLMGDMVSRGPKSHKVLNRIQKLKDKGYQLYYLRGNHEQMILNTINKSAAQRKRALKAYKALSLLEEKEIHAVYRKLIEESVHYVDTEDYFLVHAGFNFNVENPFEHSYPMLHIRDFKPKKKHLNNRGLVVGHQPKSLKEIIKQIEKNKRLIYIDNGCVNTKIEGQGNLIALNLDSLEIIMQPNIDG